MRFRIIKKPLYKAAYVTLCPPKINKTNASVMAQQTKKLIKRLENLLSVSHHEHARNSIIPVD